jgi:hypothetical protein
MKVQDLRALQLLLENEMDFDSICQCFPGYKKTTEKTSYRSDYLVINSEKVMTKKANCS